MLEAARELFATAGLAVPLDDIARRAGVGAGTVYRHFPTKEALFEAVIIERLEQLADEVRSLAETDDPGPAFFSFLTRLFAEGAVKLDIMDALTRAGINLDPISDPITHDLRESLARLLARAQGAGAVRADIGVTEVIVLLIAITLAVRQHPHDEALRRRLVAVVCDGLRQG